MASPRSGAEGGGNVHRKAGRQPPYNKEEEEEDGSSLYFCPKFAFSSGFNPEDKDCEYFGPATVDGKWRNTTTAARAPSTLKKLITLSKSVSRTWWRVTTTARVR